MSRKYKYGGYALPYVRPEPGYNCASLVSSYSSHATEKQMKYINDLRKTCEKVGIDLSNIEFHTKSISGAKSTIRALLTILTKNGYDSKGNRLNEKEDANNDTKEAD